ncbi:putative DNA-binding protein (MmcQ/YjbR family) [Pontibacter ummariensis]|uniref:Predicted DNA-binding protein, MmcQ/YjbR family n=1 Tax=Pontibacter ummariensis TaxID=1610492 RepID=A0A239BRF6_9BACT|nr:MmcQ/YjbR family DNA-binding protein [Pontibacter ummariensis]PRY15703.1 putative DNA-binding protein (MmcQ/YjbR family) [Pontibacter ummariensis]SNS09723.1 Predicted DNA-binding protein, MmcQ/YjbR family [Pontibacter ummariensis]
MNIEEFREYCLAKPATTEELPFDDDTLVFKVCGKMFALCSLAAYANGIALKCDPDQAVYLREAYPQVKPGYHMNKKHWNTVLPEAGVPENLLRQWIEDSYQLVVAKLPKAQQRELKVTL